MVGRPHPESKRTLTARCRPSILRSRPGRLREENERREDQRNSITLRKGGGLNVVLLAMKAGDRIEEHSAPGAITLSVHESRIRFTAEGEAAVEAGPETILACDAGVCHAVEALSEAVCLISVATCGSVWRSMSPW